MKGNPGRKNRRRLQYKNRREAGKRRAKWNEYVNSHKFLKQYREQQG